MTRLTGLPPSRKVIHKTFEPLVEAGQALPGDLAPRLLHRFSTGGGYSLDPQLLPLLTALRRSRASQTSGKLVIGVITNSDDRVPQILSSFGFNVSPLRFGTRVDQAAIAEAVYHVDFHCMSY